jgi:hypothetical protein
MRIGYPRILMAMVLALSHLLFVITVERAVAETYDFKIDEFESKPFEWSGYAEVKYEHLNLDKESAFYGLNFYNDPRDTLNRSTGTMQLELGYKKGLAAFNTVLNARAAVDDLGGSDRADVFEAKLSLKPTPSVTVDLGKKVFKWGKGYAWNPVGFINRPKDPNNPEDSLEGYLGVGIDLIKSFSGPLQTLALTAVLLPVWTDVNGDFGKKDHVNFAAKLYLLYRDTDIDLMAFVGDSRSTRFGIDFSRNLATNFEIHAEYAYLTDLEQKYLTEAGLVATRRRSVSQYLLGLRYLTKNDITTIFEYYHNGAGFTKSELDRFYELVDDANQQFITTGSDNFFQSARTISRMGYSAPQAGRNYLYLKISQKEPFDILYFTPGIIGIFNIDDASYSLSPEMLYTGFTNWEIRVRYTYLGGSRFTEFKEKQNQHKAELRVRFFF